jgi:membrane associated rhomboid family serine protease
LHKRRDFGRAERLFALAPTHVLALLVPLGFFSQIMRLPALLVLGLGFILQSLLELGAPKGAGVAFRAHIGGLIASMLLIPLFQQRRIKLIN